MRHLLERNMPMAASNTRAEAEQQRIRAFLRTEATFFQRITEIFQSGQPPELSPEQIEGKFARVKQMAADLRDLRSNLGDDLYNEMIGLLRGYRDAYNALYQASKTGKYNQSVESEIIKTRYLGRRLYRHFDLWGQG